MSQSQLLDNTQYLITVLFLGLWGLIMSSMEWGSTLSRLNRGWFSSLATELMFMLYVWLSEIQSVKTSGFLHKLRDKDGCEHEAKMY